MAAKGKQVKDVRWAVIAMNHFAQHLYALGRNFFVKRDFYELKGVGAKLQPFLEVLVNVRKVLNVCSLFFGQCSDWEGTNYNLLASYD